jgi:pyruvate formate lyase activating enzyme
MISRRKFLADLAKVAPLFGGTGILLSEPFWRRVLRDPDIGLLFAQSSIGDPEKSPRARYWTSPQMGAESCMKCHNTSAIRGKKHVHKNRTVKCLLCAQGCTIEDGMRGRCRTRMNVGGQLRSLVYGHPVSIHVDPIEKKPFYHFMPGSAAFSLATAGCPLKCKFCQNWEISQASPEDFRTPYTPPSQIVKAAWSRQAPVIAFTYNEPTVFTEYLLDIAREAKKQNIRSVLISCGIMNELPLNDMCSVLNAIKIDLKGYSESFYRDVCSAELKSVLRSIKQVAKKRVHLEIVNLVVPTLNDSDRMISGLIDWIMGELGPDVPVHFNRFHPHYQFLNQPPTPVATLERAREMAMRKGIHYAYVGNVPDHPGNDTYCPSCKKAIIRRKSFFIMEMNIKAGRCGYCKRKIAGVWT